MAANTAGAFLGVLLTVSLLCMRNRRDGKVDSTTPLPDNARNLQGDRNNHE